MLMKLGHYEIDYGSILSKDNVEYVIIDYNNCIDYYYSTITVLPLNDFYSLDFSKVYKESGLNTLLIDIENEEQFNYTGKDIGNDCVNIETCYKFKKM